MSLSLIQVFYQIVTPVIGIPLTGYLFGGKLRICTRTLNRVTYFFFVPAFVFNIFSSSAHINEKILSVLPAVFVIQVVITLTVVLVSKLMKNPGEITSAYVISSAFPNIGNFALPLLIFRFGEIILVDAALLFLIVLIHAFAISVFFAGRESGLVKRILSVLKTPAILAFFAALLFQNTGAKVPLPVERITELMGDAMIPVMLFNIGAQIAEIKKISFDRHVFTMTFLRLIVAPSIAFFLLPLFALDKNLHDIALIDFAMPTALLAGIIATEHNIAPQTVIMTVLFSTLGSIVSLTILLAIV